MLQNDIIIALKSMTFSFNDIILEIWLIHFKHLENEKNIEVDHQISLSLLRESGFGLLNALV